MKNIPAVWFIFLLSTVYASGQRGQLIVQHDEKGLHLEHMVVAKEGIYSVGRLYNVHPRFLASYNHLDINAGLNIGQVIHIPLTDTNFSQRTNKGTPVYYRVGEKEGLMKVSNTHNKVKLQSLREWNKLPNDNIKSGSKLIVGFLVSPGFQAAVASGAPKEEVKKTTEAKPVVKTEPVAEMPVAKKDTAAAGQIVKEEVNKQEPVGQEPVIDEVVQKTEPVTAKQEVAMNGAAQGYFRVFFDQQVKQHPATRSETVTAGVFHTTAGLKDAKYYMLINKIIPGTIVRVVNPENGRVIYAKVLGEMDGIRLNKGLGIRISNLAAATLGITDTDKFIVKISY